MVFCTKRFTDQIHFIMSPLKQKLSVEGDQQAPSSARKFQQPPGNSQYHRRPCIHLGIGNTSSNKNHSPQKSSNLNFNFPKDKDKNSGFKFNLHFNGNFSSNFAGFGNLDLPARETTELAGRLPRNPRAAAAMTEAGAGLRRSQEQAAALEGPAQRSAPSSKDFEAGFATGVTPFGSPNLALRPRAGKVRLRAFSSLHGRESHQPLKPSLNLVQENPNPGQGLAGPFFGGRGSTNCLNQNHLSDTSTVFSSATRPVRVNSLGTGAVPLADYKRRFNSSITTLEESGSRFSLGLGRSQKRLSVGVSRQRTDSYKLARTISDVVAKSSCVIGNFKEKYGRVGEGMSNLKNSYAYSLFVATSLLR